MRKEILFVLKAERKVRTLDEGNTGARIVGLGPGENFFSGLQQGRTGKGGRVNKLSRKGLSQDGRWAQVASTKQITT
jgi:hypothetical protein